MGTSALKSAAITNRDASPRVVTNSNLMAGSLMRARGFVTSVAADDTASRYRMFELPSNCIVDALYISSVAQGAGAVNVGVYRNTADGGAVVSASLFAAAFSVASAVTRSDITNQATTYTGTKQEQQLWQAAGLTVDPRTTFDIVIAPSTAFTNGGIVQLVCYYVT